MSFEYGYRAGRVRGITALGLRPGDRVLDVGCGTGLNFPLLREGVGPTGRVIGADASATMVRGADRQIASNGRSNVEFRIGDAEDLNSLFDVKPLFDAVLFTYALSVIEDWSTAYAQATRRLRDGGRLLVVDLALPTGNWRMLSPLARAACFADGADWRREA